MSTQKKILCIITQADMGGAQRFLYAFVRHLRENNFDVRVALGRDGRGPLRHQLETHGIPMIMLKHLRRQVNPLADISSVFEIRALIKNYKPDTVFLMSSKAGFIGSLATVFPTSIPHLNVVYRIGGWTFNDPWPNWKKRLWKNLEKWSAQWKDSIIVSGQSDLNQAHEIGIVPRKQIRPIYNGLDIYNFRLLPREEARTKILAYIKNRTGKDITPLSIVGTIANFYPPKGIEYLIKSAPHFAPNGETAFVIIGDGYEREKLEALIQSEGVTDRVFLIGRIPEASQYLSAFDVFALPSLKEGFPWALIEAMAARLPIVATRVGAVPEIIEDGKNGLLVEPGNSPRLAMRIKEILADEGLAQELAIQAHQTMLFKFDEKTMLKEVEALL